VVSLSNHVNGLDAPPDLEAWFDRLTTNGILFGQRG